MKQNYKAKLGGDAIHFRVTIEGGAGNGPLRDAHRANPAVQIETSVWELH